MQYKLLPVPLTKENLACLENNAYFLGRDDADDGSASGWESGSAASLAASDTLARDVDSQEPANGSASVSVNQEGRVGAAADAPSKIDHDDDDDDFWDAMDELPAPVAALYGAAYMAVDAIEPFQPYIEQAGRLLYVLGQLSVSSGKAFVDHVYTALCVVAVELAQMNARLEQFIDDEFHDARDCFDMELPDQGDAIRAAVVVVGPTVEQVGQKIYGFGCHMARSLSHSLSVEKMLRYAIVGGKHHFMSKGRFGPAMALTLLEPHADKLALASVASGFALMYLTPQILTTGLSFGVYMAVSRELRSQVQRLPEEYQSIGILVADFMSISTSELATGYVGAGLLFSATSTFLTTLLDDGLLRTFAEAEREAYRYSEDQLVLPRNASQTMRTVALFKELDRRFRQNEGISSAEIDATIRAVRWMNSERMTQMFTQLKTTGKVTISQMNAFRESLASLDAQLGTDEALRFLLMKVMGPVVSGFLAFNYQMIPLFFGASNVYQAPLDVVLPWPDGCPEGATFPRCVIGGPWVIPLPSVRSDIPSNLTLFGEPIQSNSLYTLP